MRSIFILFVAAVVGLATQTTWADVLELKNGQVLNGKYAGGTAGTLRFETAKGVQVLTTGEVLALTFTGQNAAATPEAKSQPAEAQSAETTPAAKPAPVTLTVPSGTTLLVRMADGASSQDAKGKRFAATLDTDLAVDDVVIAKAGTRAYGRVEDAQQAGRYAGQSMLDIRLTELSVDGKAMPIVTGPYAQVGSRSVGKTAKGALVGAAIGSIADGTKGAGKGAAIGAVASGLKKGEAIVIKPGELLEFQLQQALSVTVQKGK